MHAAAGWATGQECGRVEQGSAVTHNALRKKAAAFIVVLSPSRRQLARHCIEVLVALEESDLPVLEIWS